MTPASYLEPEPSHTTPVLVDGALAVLLRVGGGREEHALVALGFLVFTYAAWLHHSSVQPIDQSERGMLTLGLEAAASEVMAALAFAPASREADSEGMVRLELWRRVEGRLTHV
jgi:hypothetical protein